MFCQKFSHWDAFWRRFFASVALWVGKDRKWAYFELSLETNELERGVLMKEVEKLSCQHGMLTNGTKD